MNVNFYLVLVATVLVWQLDQWLDKRRFLTAQGPLSDEAIKPASWVAIANYALAASWIFTIWRMVRTGEANFELVLLVSTLLVVLISVIDRWVFEPKRLAVMPQTAAEVHPLQPAVAENARSFLFVLALVVLVRSFLAEPFTIPSGSMNPTLLEGDYILVNKYHYGFRMPVTGQNIIPVSLPERGDVLVFRYPENPGINYIKRVVGLPGDRIDVYGSELQINGEVVQREVIDEHFVTGHYRALDGSIHERQEKVLVYAEQLIADHDITIQYRERSYPQESMLPDYATPYIHVTVPEGHYFVMGDNRDNSRDSRFWGYVPEQNIVGKAVFKWMYKEPGMHLPRFDRAGVIE